MRPTPLASELPALFTLWRCFRCAGQVVVKVLCLEGCITRPTPPQVGWCGSAALLRPPVLRCLTVSWAGGGTERSAAAALFAGAALPGRALDLGGIVWTAAAALHTHASPPPWSQLHCSAALPDRLARGGGLGAAARRSAVHAGGWLWSVLVLRGCRAQAALACRPAVHAGGWLLGTSFAVCVHWKKGCNCVAPCCACWWAALGCFVDGAAKRRLRRRADLLSVPGGVCCCI